MSTPTMNKTSQLEQLKKFTRVAADTADFESMRAYNAQEGTTNPSLILAAAQKTDYAVLLDQTITDLKNATMSRSAKLEAVMDSLMVTFGVEILKIVPGRISTEVDVRLSFDREASINKGRHLISLYEKQGVSRERVLIKIAATWEGIKAAEQLQKESINCNLTVLFSFPQAVVCAEAKVKTIAPYVGRIYDWYKKSTGREYAPNEDPGVLLVKRIYDYYRKHGHETEIMGASFRSTGEILELAGCDLLTISPDLLEQLARSTDPIEAKLTPQKAKASNIERVNFDEKTFRFEMNEDAMATEKMAEAIRRFTADTLKLEELVDSKI
ncbi:MAG TPA: transaldolase [Terrimicrobiaceae bacterium]